MRFSGSAGVAVLAGGWLAVTPAWAEPIGSATDVQRAGHRSEPGATTRVEIETDDAVFLGDRITTNDNGRLRLALDDDSVLVVGPGSRLTLDEFVYAGDDSTFVMDLSTGGFRFLSGDMPSSSYVINTPTASVGLRGTDFVGIYDLVNQVLIIIVLAGQVWVEPADLPDGVTVLSAGQTAELLSSSSLPTVTVSGALPSWAGVTTERGSIPFDGDRFGGNRDGSNPTPGEVDEPAPPAPDPPGGDDGGLGGTF